MKTLGPNQMDALRDLASRSDWPVAWQVAYSIRRLRRGRQDTAWAVSDEGVARTLTRLAARGLVRHRPSSGGREWAITPSGRDALKEARSDA